MTTVLMQTPAGDRVCVNSWDASQRLADGWVMAADVAEQAAEAVGEPEAVTGKLAKSATGKGASKAS